MKIRISTLALLLACSVVSVEASCKRHLNAGWDVGGAGGGVGGQGGQGAGTACVPGETRPCYDGPEGTENKGICKAGVETCFPDGSSWFSCSGAVKPAVENCATPEDEDCDGLAPPCKGNCLWSKRFGDNSPSQTGRSVVTDNAGNVLVTGVFKGEVDFGDGALSSKGMEDIFIAKFGPDGGYIWSKVFGDADSQQSFRMAVDKDSNLIVTGAIRGQVDFGGGPLSSEGLEDIFVAKFGPDGNHLWSRVFGDADSQRAFGIAVDKSNNLLLTGAIHGQVDFGGGPLSSEGLNDIFIAKLGPDGSHLWSRAFGDADSQAGSAIATDDADNVLVVGGFDGSVDFGGGVLTSAGGDDVFMVKLDPSGKHLWSKRFGETGSQGASNVSVDAANNLIVTGIMFGQMDLGGGTLMSAGGFDIFIAKFDANGAHLWSKRFGDANTQSSKCVAVDNMGNVLMAGDLEGQADFGGGPIGSVGGLDAFLVKFDSGGNHLWSKRFGDANDQATTGVTLDNAGNVLMTGTIFGQTDFGCGPIDSAGEGDIFVARFTP